MVRKVKRFENGFILDPVVLSPSTLVEEAKHLKEKWGFGGFPVTGKSTLSLSLAISRDENNFHNFRSTVACARAEDKTPSISETASTARS